MNITYHLLTSPGGREVNEDSVGMAEHGDAKCFILADGLGGHGGGEIASALAVSTLRQAFESYEMNESESWLQAAFNCAQSCVMELHKETGKIHELKTTLTAVVTEPDRFQWCHIGDSRIYLFRRGKFYRRTLDHSVPQMLVAAGEIKEKEIRNHPDRNRLLRVIGTEWESPRFELSRLYSVSPGDAILLCSDGFWELVEEKQMEKLLKRAVSVEEWVQLMEEEVLRNGRDREMDNYSAVAVWLR